LGTWQNFNSCFCISCSYAWKLNCSKTLDHTFSWIPLYLDNLIRFKFFSSQLKS
jgi:hypothetical protein